MKKSLILVLVIVLSLVSVNMVYALSPPLCSDIHMRVFEYDLNGDPLYLEDVNIEVYLIEEKVDYPFGGETDVFKTNNDGFAFFPLIDDDALFRVGPGIQQYSDDELVNYYFQFEKEGFYNRNIRTKEIKEYLKNFGCYGQNVVDVAMKRIGFRYWEKNCDDDSDCFQYDECNSRNICVSVETSGKQCVFDSDLYCNPSEICLQNHPTDLCGEALLGESLSVQLRPFEYDIDGLPVYLNPPYYVNIFDGFGELLNIEFIEEDDISSTGYSTVLLITNEDNEGSITIRKGDRFVDRTVLINNLDFGDVNDIALRRSLFSYERKFCSSNNDCSFGSCVNFDYGSYCSADDRSYCGYSDSDIDCGSEYLCLPYSNYPCMEGEYFISDGDSDGLNDQEEILLRTEPGNPDTDGDEILDGEDSDPLNSNLDCGRDTDCQEGYYCSKGFFSFLVGGECKTITSKYCDTAQKNNCPDGYICGSNNLCKVSVTNPIYDIPTIPGDVLRGGVLGSRCTQNLECVKGYCGESVSIVVGEDPYIYHICMSCVTDDQCDEGNRCILGDCVEQSGTLYTYCGDDDYGNILREGIDVSGGEVKEIQKKFEFSGERCLKYSCDGVDIVDERVDNNLCNLVCGENPDGTVTGFTSEEATETHEKLTPCDTEGKTTRWYCDNNQLKSEEVSCNNYCIENLDGTIITNYLNEEEIVYNTDLEPYGECADGKRVVYSCEENALTTSESGCDTEFCQLNYDGSIIWAGESGAGSTVGEYCSFEGNIVNNYCGIDGFESAETACLAGRSCNLIDGDARCVSAGGVAEDTEECDLSLDADCDGVLDSDDVDDKDFNIGEECDDNTDCREGGSCQYVTIEEEDISACDYTLKETEQLSCQSEGGLVCDGECVGQTADGLEFREWPCCLPSDGVDVPSCKETKFNPILGKSIDVTQSACVDEDGDGIGEITFTLTGDVNDNDLTSLGMTENTYTEECTILPKNFKEGKDIPYYGVLSFILSLGLIGIYYRRVSDINKL